MLSDALLEKTALFYYFAFLDEGKAQAATARTIKILQKRNITEKSSDEQAHRAFVSVTNEMVNTHKGEARAAMFSFSSGHIVLPEKSNWGPWFEFRKVAEEADFIALLYARILKIDENVIAQGLGVPLGTVRHRLGRGLKALGKICSASGVGLSHA